MSEDLQKKYEEIYASGKKFFFDEGYEERNMILQSGWPWAGKTVLEIGCGQGDLAAMIAASGAHVWAIDTSETAIKMANDKYPANNPGFWNMDSRQFAKFFEGDKYDVLVLQGLLEHLTHPWDEFQYMVDTFQPETIVVSAPCFLNPRGYIWLTLHTLLKAPMSLTDKHHLHPWDFVKFAQKNELIATMATCEKSWGNGPKMLEDYKKRLPKVFQDMNSSDPMREALMSIASEQCCETEGCSIEDPMCSTKIAMQGLALGSTIKGRFSDLFNFLEQQYQFFTDYEENTIGAVAVYNITKQPR